MPCMTGSRGLFMVIEESKMRFEFPDERMTVKFDEELFYRNSFNQGSPIFGIVYSRKIGI